MSFFAVFAGYGIAVILDNLIKPFLYRGIIDYLAQAGPKDAIITHVFYLFFGSAVIILVHNVFYRLGDYANSYFESKVMKRLYDATFNKLLFHSYSFFANNFAGGLVAKTKRFVRGFETLQDILSFQIWFSFINVIGILIVLFIQIPTLGFIFLGWSFLYVGITALFIKRKVGLDIQEAAADSVVTSHLADSITNILNIKIFSGGEMEKDRFATVTDDEEKKRKRSWYFGNFQNLIQAFLMAILQIVVLLINIHFWYLGKISIGTFVLVQTYMVGLFDVLWNLGRSLTRAVKSLSDMKEVIDIFDQKPDILDIANPEKCLISKGKINFKNIHFEYIKDYHVFKNFDLEIKSGEKVGLVGHSGSGKSTIVKMLLRFADVRRGEILIDGQNIAKVKQDDLRAKISYVPQESILFHRSIRENIAYANPQATEENIIEAAKRAHAHEFILKLPYGYKTLVGERGVKLSGGERQRVAIARAMLKNAPILLLDEATSSLDSISESYIQDAFNELMKGKTTLVIAHRLSTVQKMDRIIVLEKGEIVEEGTHQELLEKKGFYADLWNHQTGGFLE